MGESVYVLEKQETDSKQKLGVYALQKQLEVLKLKEYLLLASFAFGAAFLRVPMQVVPSAEPITFFAMLAGWLFGSKKGFAVGASSLFLSNYVVMGGQGPWTVFQVAGFGLAGFLGGFLRKNASKTEVVIYVVVATIIFEFIMNTSSIFFVGFNLPAAFIMSIPFGIVHLVSNVSFALLLPKAKKLFEEKGGFTDRELGKQLLAKIKNKPAEAVE